MDRGVLSVGGGIGGEQNRNSGTGRRVGGRPVGLRLKHIYICSYEHRNISAIDTCKGIECSTKE